MGIFSFLKTNIFSRIKSIFSSSNNDIKKCLEDIEEVLLSADVGIKTTEKLINLLRDKIKGNNIEDSISFLKEEINKIMFSINDNNQKEINPGKLQVIMLIGVNGVGKTTTVAKLANRYKREGKRVIVGAADTFRAAAVEQARMWCDKYGIAIEEGSDKDRPSTVIYKTLARAQEEKYDIAIIDTAGRLHNKIALMDELEKMFKNISRFIEKYQQKVYVVIDGTTGQNVFSQIEHFKSIMQIDGIIITKADGISKSGFIIGIYDKCKIPVVYLGIGEGINDIVPFDKKQFVNSIIEM